MGKDEEGKVSEPLKDSKDDVEIMRDPGIDIQNITKELLNGNIEKAKFFWNRLVEYPRDQLNKNTMRLINNLRKSFSKDHIINADESTIPYLKEWSTMCAQELCHLFIRLAQSHNNVQRDKGVVTNDAVKLIKNVILLQGSTGCLNEFAKKNLFDEILRCDEHKGHKDEIYTLISNTWEDAESVINILDKMAIVKRLEGKIQTGAVFNQSGIDQDGLNLSIANSKKLENHFECAKLRPYIRRYVIRANKSLIEIMEKLIELIENDKQNKRYQKTKKDTCGP